jgi:hypothetical protein
MRGGKSPTSPRPIADRRVALITHRGFPKLHEDDQRLERALRRRGIAASPAIWDDAKVDWAEYDLLVIRSPWDYFHGRDRFLAWARQRARTAPIVNRLPTLVWNTDKHYLAELERAGIPTIPTRWIEPGQAGRLDALLDAEAWTRFVVKPAVSADGFLTEIFGRGDRPSARRHLRRVLRHGSAMLQPYDDSVEQYGEISVIFLGGRFSHAVRKPSVLQPDGRRMETKAARTRSVERELGLRVLAEAPDPPFYARIDLLSGPGRSPVLLEAELTEPSLFFGWKRGSDDRLATLLREELRR